MGRSKEEKLERLAKRQERRKKLLDDKLAKGKEKIETKEIVKKEEVKKEKSSKKRRTFSVMEIILISFATLLIGCLIGKQFTILRLNEENPYKNSKAFEVYKDIKDNFNGFITDDFEYSQIEGMIYGLSDNHAIYLRGNYALEYKQQLNNEFVGIGTEVQMLDNKDVIFTSVYKDSPAEKAGIQVGDLLVGIDDDQLIGLSLDEIVFKIKGKNTKKEVTVTVSRNGEPMDLVITKENIVPKSVTVEYLKDDTIAVVSIKSFTTKTLNEFKKVLDEVKEKEIRNLAIDVRDNSLGYVKVASDIASLFLEKDSIIYKEIYNDREEVVRSENDKLYDFNIAIVQNTNSSKASEVLASALKNHSGANIIGFTSRGDSTLQKMIELENGDIIEYTVGKWLTSLNVDVGVNRLLPNYKVKEEKDLEKMNQEYNDKIIESFNKSI